MVLIAVLVSLAVVCPPLATAARTTPCGIPGQGEEIIPDVRLPHDVATGAGVGIALVDTGASSPGVVAGRAGSDLDLDHCVLHGSAVAGVLHAVAPDAVVVSHRQDNDDGTGTVAGLVDALDRAVAHALTSEHPQVRVVNMSLVACLDTAELRRAVTAAEDAGLLVVVAAGNSGQCPAQTAPFPASLPGVLTVGAVDTRISDSRQVADLGPGRRPADYSVPGPWVDLHAPGGPVSTVLASTTGAVTVTGDPDPFIGTSFAAPVVSATAALVWQIRPDLTADRVREILLSTAQHGAVPVIDPAAAVTAALDNTVTTPPRISPWQTPVPVPGAQEPGTDLRVPVGLALPVTAVLVIARIRRSHDTSTVHRARSTVKAPPSGSRSMTAQGTATGRLSPPGNPRDDSSSGEPTV